MIPIKRKVELALVAYLASLESLAGIPVLAGHQTAKRALPCIVVYGEKASENDAFPSGTGVFDVLVKVFVLTQSDDEDLTIHDGRVAAVQAALFDFERIREALNISGIGPDTRAVKDLHFYDLIEMGSDEGRDDRHFGEVLNYTAICQGVDGNLCQQS